MQEVYRIKVTEALGWALHNASLGEALRDAAVTGRLQEMEVEWEKAGGDFWSAYRLDIQVEGDEFVVHLVDETGGRCPHGEDPALCDACQEFSSRCGMQPFWMRRRCVSCGEQIPAIRVKAGGLSGSAFTPGKQYRVTAPFPVTVLINRGREPQPGDVLTYVAPGTGRGSDPGIARVFEYPDGEEVEIEYLLVAPPLEEVEEQ